MYGIIWEDLGVKKKKINITNQQTNVFHIIKEKGVYNRTTSKVDETVEQAKKETFPSRSKRLHDF